MKAIYSVILAIVILALGFLSGYYLSQEKISMLEKPAEELVLATTTSTVDTGLLDALNKPFEEKYNCRVKVLRLGTGEALKTAEMGNADVVLVHARKAEDKFVGEGYGVNRRDVMHNDFIVIGPLNDPAGIKGIKNAAEAFKKIAQTELTFFSRGDNSGTHQKEREIWANAGITPVGKWYKPVGKGMGDTIIITNEKQGYTLSDRGTYLAMEKNINLVVLIEGDPILFNPYGVIAINPSKYPKRNYQLAMAYIGYITSPQGQKIIKDYGKYMIIDPLTKKQQSGYGQPLFYPDAINITVLEKL